MNHVLIVEDDPLQLEMLSEIICEKYPDWMIEVALDFEEGKKLLEKSIYSECLFTLFLFDVKLSEQIGDKGGFVLAKEARKYAVYYKTPILFMSGFLNDYLYALSEIHCYNYIVKPFAPEDMLFQIEQMLHTGYLVEDSSYFLVIVDTSRIWHKILTNDIYMIESKSHTLIIHTKNEYIVTRVYTLEKMLKIIGSDFVQCHRGIDVNIKYIENYDKTSKYIKIVGRQVAVGRAYQSRLEMILGKQQFMV